MKQLIENYISDRNEKQSKSYDQIIYSIHLSAKGSKRLTLNAPPIFFSKMLPYLYKNHTGSYTHKHWQKIKYPAINIRTLMNYDQFIMEGHKNKKTTIYILQ